MFLYVLYAPLGRMVIKDESKGCMEDRIVLGIFIFIF